MAIALVILRLKTSSNHSQNLSIKMIQTIFHRDVKKLIETLDSFYEFFQFILGLFRTEVPNKAAVIKFWMHEGIYYCFFFFMAHKCLCSLQVAFS